MDRANVLFVDDERFALAAMERLLFKQSYNIFLAANGQEALEIMAAQPIHVIVSDMRMPGIDGLQLLSMVKDLYPGIVRMVLSAYAQTSQLLPCICYRKGKNHRTLCASCEGISLLPRCALKGLKQARC